MNADQTSRLGALTDDRFVFHCAACGDVAATIQVLTYRPADDENAIAGDELRPRPEGRPKFVLRFVNTNSGDLGRSLEELLVGTSTVDPMGIREVDWELAAYCCRGCDLNYCYSCWSPWVEYADDHPGWYECTRGRCPRGHVQKLDD